MENSELNNHVHHVFWTQDRSPIGKKFDSAPEGLKYRRCDNPKYLQNVLKKYIGGPEELKKAFKEDSLRAVLGVSVQPVPSLPA